MAGQFQLYLEISQYQEFGLTQILQGKAQLVGQTKQMILQKAKGKPSRSSLLLLMIFKNSKYLTYFALESF